MVVPVVIQISHWRILGKAIPLAMSQAIKEVVNTIRYMEIIGLTMALTKSLGFSILFLISLPFLPLFSPK